MQQYLRSRYLVPKTVRTQTSTGNLVPFITLGNIDFYQMFAYFVISLIKCSMKLKNVHLKKT